MADFITNCGFVPTAGGTTDWTYSAAVAGYQSPTAAQAVNSAIYVFRAQSADNSQWEYAVGAYNSGTGVFARTIVLYNSSGTGTKQGGGGTKITFTLAPSLVAIVAIAEELVPAQAATPCVRLTLTSGTPITTSDVTAATNVYVTPYNGNIITLYDGAIWVPVKFTEVTLSLSGFTASTNYDVWGRVSSGALAVDTTAWTNDTTRATAIAQQDGIDIKSGDTTRRLLGTVRITGTTGQTEDSVLKRYLSNRYNQAIGSLKATDTTDTWTYSTSSWRQANNSTSNQVDAVFCVGAAIYVGARHMVSNSTSTARNGWTGIGVSSTTVSSSVLSIGGSMNGSGVIVNCSAEYIGTPGVGRYYFAWLENGAGADTQTWYGDAGTNGDGRAQCGIFGYLNR